MLPVKLISASGHYDIIYKPGEGIRPPPLPDWSSSQNPVQVHRVAEGDRAWGQVYDSQSLGLSPSNIEALFPGSHFVSDATFNHNSHVSQFGYSEQQPVEYSSITAPLPNNAYAHYSSADIWNSSPARSHAIQAPHMSSQPDYFPYPSQSYVPTTSSPSLPTSPMTESPSGHKRFIPPFSPGPAEQPGSPNRAELQIRPSPYNRRVAGRQMSLPLDTEATAR